MYIKVLYLIRHLKKAIQTHHYKRADTYDPSNNLRDNLNDNHNMHILLYIPLYETRTSQNDHCINSLRKKWIAKLLYRTYIQNIHMFGDNPHKGIVHPNSQTPDQRFDIW